MYFFVEKLIQYVREQLCYLIIVEKSYSNKRPSERTSGSPAPSWQGKIIPAGNVWALSDVTTPSAPAGGIFHTDHPTAC